MVGRSVGGRVESVAFASTHALVFDVPVLLLTLDGAVACVPAAVVHRLLLAVIALTHKPHFTAALLSLSYSTDTQATFHRCIVITQL